MIRMLSNKQLIIRCSVAFLSNLAVIALFVKYNIGEKNYITINQQDISVILPDSYLSIGIDASEIEDFNKINFLNEKLQNLAMALSPARLRLGGTMSDRLIFNPHDLPPVLCDRCPHTAHKSFCSSLKKLCRHNVLPFFIMTGPKWTEINNFCKNNNLKLMFPLNVLLRDDHEWSQQNAMDILKYSKSNNFNVDWQLGNEPNSFRHVFNKSITPHTLGHDFKKLRKLLNHSGYNTSLLIGPDTTRPQKNQPNCLKYMIEFLGNASHYINVTSWHQYYLNSRTVKLEDFWNPQTFDLLDNQIKTMRNHTGKYDHIPMWLTETSSSFGGGAPGLSNTFAGTPLWLDKLGLAAKNNITTVVRQSFIGGNYSLLGKNLDPLPDYWLSVLYKKLVGKKVLNLTCNCSKFQRLYVHCANRQYTNDTAAITLYGINLIMKKVRFHVNGSIFNGDDLVIDEFILSAPSNNRRSKTILLNGWPLIYDSAMPEFIPHQYSHGKTIAMPPYSVGFWVIKNTSIKTCS